jgi:hypothetical protein
MLESSLSMLQQHRSAPLEANGNNDKASPWWLALLIVAFSAFGFGFGPR